MPIYTFICENCGEFEVIEPSPTYFYSQTGVDLRDDDAIIKCSKCDGPSNKDTSIKPSSFKLEGTGWYKTDYK